MSVDLTLVPWNRLEKLAPPGTSNDDLQAAADRWAITADVYSAAADIWEDKLLSIDFAPDPTPVIDPSDPMASGRVSSIAQDGISVSFAVDSTGGNTATSRYAQANQIKSIIRGLRAKSKPHSPLVHRTDYNPWRNRPPSDDDPENVIVVEP